MRIQAFNRFYVALLARLGICAFALAIGACASTGQSSVSQGSDSDSAANGSQPLASALSGSAEQGRQSVSKDYLIGPGDLLKIDVFRSDALSRQVRVNATGQIALPLIGQVQAGGLTSEQLAADISARLAKDYMQNPQVLVFIEEFTSQRVTVVGAVKKPGVYPLKGRTTLLQVVATAEGPTSVANINSVKILRPEAGGTRKMTEYNLGDIRNGKASDPEIRGEDVVQVDASAFKDTTKQVFEFVLPFWVLGSIL